MPLRRSQRIRRPTLLDDYVYLHENQFNIDQASDANSFDEAISCSKSDSLANSSGRRIEINARQNDVCDLVTFQISLNKMDSEGNIELFKEILVAKCLTFNMNELSLMGLFVSL